jgi:hypothetical protein
LEAWAVAPPPDLVAFSQAGVNSPPNVWAEENLILVEDFNSLATGGFPSELQSNGGIMTFNRVGSAHAIFADGQYGGTNGASGRYAAVGESTTITLTRSTQTNLRYVGFFWSAGNPGNTVCLLGPTSDTCLAEYNTEDLLENDAFENPGQGENNWQTKPHYGNPRGRSYTNTGSCTTVSSTEDGWNIGTAHCREPFAFIHIFHDTGFDRVRFTAPGGGFEFDNVTVSTASSAELIDLLPPGSLLGASSLPAYSLTTARVLPVDPRNGSVSFPGVLFGGAAASQPNASLCLTEVDINGRRVEGGDENLRVSATESVSGVTSQSSAPEFAYSGSQTTIRDFSRTIRINSSTANRSVAATESKYLRISVQARIGTGLTTCSASNNVITAVMVELRPMRLNSVNQLGIPID